MKPTKRLKEKTSDYLRCSSRFKLHMEIGPDGEVIGAEKLWYWVVVTALDQTFLALLPQHPIRIRWNALLGRIVQFIRSHCVLVSWCEPYRRFFETFQQPIYSHWKILRVLPSSSTTIVSNLKMKQVFDIWHIQDSKIIASNHCSATRKTKWK